VPIREYDAAEVSRVKIYEDKNLVTKAEIVVDIPHILPDDLVWLDGRDPAGRAHA